MITFALSRLFEDVRPCDHVECLMTFRANIEARSATDWRVIGIETQSPKTGAWVRMNDHCMNLYIVCLDWCESPLGGRREITDAIREAMHEQAERALWGAADDARKAA